MLDLEPGSDAKRIKSAVRKLARKVHPDKCSLPGADEAFKSVLKAAEHVSANDKGAVKLAENFVIANHAYGLHSQHAEDMMVFHAKVCHCLLQMQQSSSMMVAIGGKNGTTLSGIQKSARLRR